MDKILVKLYVIVWAQHLVRSKGSCLTCCSCFLFLFLFFVTPLCQVVSDLFSLNSGGLSKEPGQVCDSRVNGIIHHLTTKVWQTHIQTLTWKEHLYEGEKTMSCFGDPCCYSFNAIFFSPARLMYITVAYYLYLNVTFLWNLLISLLQSLVKFSPVVTGTGKAYSLHFAVLFVCFVCFSSFFFS